MIYLLIFGMVFIICRRFCDADILAYQTDRMPEMVRTKVGGVPHSQFAVYEEFAQNIPGFQLMSERDATMLLPKAASTSTPAPVSLFLLG